MAVVVKMDSMETEETRETESRERETGGGEAGDGWEFRLLAAGGKHEKVAFCACFKQRVRCV